jgi:hypothetical protein
MNVLAGHALDAEVDDTVAEEQRVADADLGGEPRVRGGHAITRALDRARREGELAAGLELDATGPQRTDADLGAREILGDRRGDVELFTERADPAEDGPVLRRFTVRSWAGPRSSHARGAPGAAPGTNWPGRPTS